MYERGMTMDKKFMKVIVGLALEESIRQLRYNKNLKEIFSQLDDLFSDPDPSSIEELHANLISSSQDVFREIGFRLEPLIERTGPDIDWRDLVIDMLETELDMFNIFHLLKISTNIQYDVDDLREWFNSIGGSVSHIKQGDWVHAKIYASRAIEFSLRDSIERIREDEHLKGAIDAFRKDTKKFFEQIKAFPAQIKVSNDRLEIIVEVQEILIELMKKDHLQRPKRIVKDVIHYPTEKLGVAQNYLLNPNYSVEQANYELGLASEHLKEKMPNVQDSQTLRWIKELWRRIETLFSELPLKPWPMEGFGEPGVESRFEE